MNKELKIDCKEVSYKHHVVEIVSDTPTNYSPASVVEHISISNTKKTNFKNIKQKKNTKWSMSKLSKYT